MLRVAALASLLVGCAPAPAERLRNPRRIKPPAYEPVEARAKPVKAGADVRLIAFPRPDIPIDVRIGALRDAMDVHDHLRWPLSANHHPVLEPAYPIAPVFADAGVAWTDLCKLGAQNRRTSGIPRDQIEYLRAWCDVARHDGEAAVVRLAPLLMSTVAGLPAAVRRDVANILVDSGDAELAQRTLARARLHEVMMFDLISASYEEVGKTADSMVFNDLAIDAYTMTKPGDHCRRLAKRVVIAGDPDERKVRLEILERVSATDTTCRDLHHELKCWSGASCIEYMADHGIDTKLAGVVDAYLRWPTEEAGPVFWAPYAAGVAALAGAPGADVLATSALEASMLSVNCAGDRVHDLRATAHDIQITTADQKLVARLEVIVSEPTKLCAKKP